MGEPFLDYSPALTIPASALTMKEELILMNLSDLTEGELKALVTSLVDDRLRELLGNPDLGLELIDTVRARLKASLMATDRLTGDEVAEKLGLRW